LAFPTKLVAEAINSSNAERAAVLVYGASLLVISILVTSIIRYVRSQPELIEEEGRDEVIALAAGASPNLVFYVVVLALAFSRPRSRPLGSSRSRCSRSCTSVGGPRLHSLGGDPRITAWSRAVFSVTPK
jgi:hypothetical protein